MSEAQRYTWQEKAKETYNFHVSKRRENRKWRIKDTARLLRRSAGSICEDLLLAEWLKSHRVQLDQFDAAYKALAFVREKELKMDSEKLT
jgi:hypothetical protein